MKKFSDLRSGDLLVWGKTYGLYPKKIFNMDYLKLVRLVTSSNYGHVSTVWVMNGKPYHVEAVSPSIRIVPVPPAEDLYVIPMSLHLSKGQMCGFFEDKIGLPYGFMDALRAWLGWTLKDEDKWQCAELCLEFYRSLGIELPNAFTPSELVRVIMRDLGKSLQRLHFE